MKILTSTDNGFAYSKFTLNFPQIQHSEIFSISNKNITFSDVEKNLKKELKRIKTKEIISFGFDGEVFSDDENVVKNIDNMLITLKQSGFPLMIATSTDSILKHIDILKQLSKNYCQIFVKIPSFDDSVLQIFQPGFPLLQQRLDVVKQLNINNISVGVYISPLLPEINCNAENVEKLVEFSAQNNAAFVMYQKKFTVLDNAKENFLRNIELRFPQVFDYYRNQLSVKNDVKSNAFMEISNVFVRTASKLGIATRPKEFNPPKQLSLF